MSSRRCVADAPGLYLSTLSQQAAAPPACQDRPRRPDLQPPHCRPEALLSALWGLCRVLPPETPCHPPEGVDTLCPRSEERRVGKECRSRWCVDERKKVLNA